MANKNTLKKLYNKYLNIIKKRVELNKKCNNKYTSNPDNVFLLGNNCYDVNKKKKLTKKNKRIIRRKSFKKSRQNGGGIIGNVLNGVNTFTHDMQAIPPAKGVLPWQDNFSRSALTL